MKEDRDEMQMTTLQNKMDKLKSKILGPKCRCWCQTFSTSVQVSLSERKWNLNGSGIVLTLPERKMECTLELQDCDY